MPADAGAAATAYLVCVGVSPNALSTSRLRKLTVQNRETASPISSTLAPGGRGGEQQEGPRLEPHHVAGMVGHLDEIEHLDVLHAGEFGELLLEPVDRRSIAQPDQRVDVPRVVVADEVP